MVGSLYDAISSRRYLPLYRMGDGEYRFALGGSTGKKWVDGLIAPRPLLRALVARLSGRWGHHKSGSPEYGFEEYNPIERPLAYKIFVDSLRVVAKRGILGLALHDTRTYERYLGPMLSWFEENQISLHRQNYYHVYSVYVLLHGPESDLLLNDRRVLVATGLTEEKKAGIERGLREKGVKSVQFLPLSSQKAMLDVVDLHAIKERVDLVLVGAGVGSVSILVQLEPLGVPCLDVGFALSTIAEPQLRWKRPFCIPDTEFKRERVEFL